LPSVAKSHRRTGRESFCDHRLEVEPVPLRYRMPRFNSQPLSDEFAINQGFKAHPLNLASGYSRISVAARSAMRSMS
jgi:hypothetical protein